jgi:thiosulfate dehydrogenase [quinone] large subunit
MSTKHRSQTGTRLPDPNFVHPEVIAPETTAGKALRYVNAAIRISIGWVFLWAFIDKVWGFGFATPTAKAWINGGSPTTGFLKGATGPLASTYHSMSGQSWADWLFMAGLLGIGLALVLGVGMRIAAAAGSLLLVLMWSAELPLANNPFMDEHLVYAMVLVALALAGAGRTVGLGRQWERLSFVQRNGWLK